VKPRAAFIVNSPGLQVRRAEAMRNQLACRLEIDVVVAPSLQQVLSGLREWTLVYVIDAGRAGFQAAAMSRLAGRPVIVELGDPQAALYAAQSRGRLAMGLGRFVDRTVTLGATGVVVRGRELANILDVRVPWVTIPDGVDLEQFRAGLGTGVRARLGLADEDFVMGLVGSIVWSEARQITYGMEIVEALSDLRDLPVYGLVVGDGTGIQHIVRRATELGVLDRVVMVGFVDHGDVANYIGAMDVCISTQTNDSIGRGRTTAKLPEYLACDRHVLSTAVPSATAILPEEMIIQVGEPLGSDYYAAVAERVRALLHRQPELRQSGGTRALAEQHFCYPLLADRLHAFIQAVC